MTQIPKNWDVFRDPSSGKSIDWDKNNYPIIKNVPRFVGSEQYCDTFGMQWTRHREIYMGRNKMRVSLMDQAKRKLGITPAMLKGKRVLEIGVGTGALASQLAPHCELYVGVDLSLAVESAAVNCTDMPNVVLAQADLFKLPFEPHSFDIVLSMGVLHHTPSTQAAVEAVSKFVKPGGLLAFWIYYSKMTFPHRLWMSDQIRKFTTKMNPETLYKTCKLANLYYKAYQIPLLGKAIHASMPPISREPNPEERVLDTFDWYSPTYQHRHSWEEAEGWLKKLGFKEIQRHDVAVGVSATLPA